MNIEDFFQYLVADDRSRGLALDLVDVYYDRTRVPQPLAKSA
jgi:hypothetical protein